MGFGDNPSTMNESSLWQRRLALLVSDIGRGLFLVTHSSLAMLGLAHLADRPAADVTPSQQRLLEIGMALGTRPRLLLLDEVAAGLTESEVDAMALRIRRLPVGRAWEALREDEIACRSLGLNPMKIKLSAFTLGAMFAGFGGAFFAARQGIVNPESFTFIESALILAIVVLGGMGSQLGVILAAILLTALPEIAREFAEYRMLIFGLVMILMMVWRPQGLLPMQRHHVEVK